MFSQPCRHRRRSGSCRPFLLILGFTFLLLAPVMDTVAQALPIRAQPTAVPTEEFDPPLAAEPTATPTPRVTEEPEAPDDVVANPTAVPTDAPEPAAPSSLTLNKGACDDSGFDAYSAQGLDTFLEACQSPDGEFEFTVSNGGGFESTQSTALGTLFMQVPTGPITITETIPSGWGEPAVFCWSNLLQSVSGEPFIGNGPEWNVAEGEDVECWWFNVSDPGGGHDFHLDKYECPEGFDTASDWQAFSLGCTVGMDGVGFNVTDGQGPMFQETVDGGAVWPGIDFGDGGEIVITETIPEGYGEPVVFCTILLAGAADPEDFDTQQMTVTEGRVTAAPVLGEQDHYHCAFFNIPEAGAPDDLTAAETQDGNTVTVNKHRCPMGVAEDASPFDYMEICTAEDDDIEFTLDHDGGSFPATAAGGQVQWTDVPAGDFEIQETLPAGYLDPLVFCNFTELPDGGLPQPEPVPAAGGLVTGNFENAGSEYVCWWFNIQDPDANNSLTIYTYACPAGTDPDSNDNDYYKATCGDAHPGVDFTLTAPHGEFVETTDGDGMVAWTGIPLGDFSVQETIPEGYGEPVVLCNFLDVIQGIGFQNGPLGRIQSPGGLVSGLIEEPNVEYLCSWFNIPMEDEPVSRVLVNKRICPADVDFVLTDENSIDDIITACPETGEGIEFTLDNADGSSTQAIDGDGDTYWDDVPLGPFTITEDIPAGYGEPVWYCAFNHYEDGEIVPVPPVAAVAPGGVHAASFDDPNGGVYYCWVFNVPGDSNDIVIHKWLCPEGFDPNSSDQEYFDTCTESLDGISFKAMSDLGIAVLETVGGQVGFGGFPAGMNVGIQEEIPGEYGNPYVICEFDDDAWHDVGAQSGYFEIFFGGSGETVECHVFNLHGDDPDLTILKWTCPEGYDLFAWGADPQADCTEVTNGVTFELRYEGHDEIEESQTTGEVIEGGVFFDDLQPDLYHVTELVPDGTDHVFVLECTGHLMGVLQPYPLQMGNVLESIDLDAGEHLTCHWYNVPASDGGKLTVIKYTCSTETFVSEVDCEIEEDGKTFDLLHWNTDTGEWEATDTQVTDGAGQIAWLDLAAGDYGLDEHDGEWCHLTTNPVFGEGDFFSVFEAEETAVNVYNCDGEPGKPGDTPTKYPNTGAGPDAPGPARELPAVAPIAGLLALLAGRISRHRSSAATRAGTQAGPDGRHPHLGAKLS